DDWRIRPNLTLNLGARWQFVTNEKNLSGYSDLDPIVRPFLRGDRARDKNNFAPRVGFAWAMAGDRFVMRGGSGLFFAPIPLQCGGLEGLLDGRGTAIAVAGGGATLLPGGNFAGAAPTAADPFAGAKVVWPNAPGVNILDNSLQNPMAQQASLELEGLITKR